MVYGIVQRHGAELEIESAPSEGTLVRVSFPAAPSASSPGRAALDLATLPRQRILVIDDDPLILHSLRDTLEADGHVVVTANQGQDGIDTFRSGQEQSKPFDVVITDLGMPHVDGRKVARSIKTDSPNTRVILLTGWGHRLQAEGDVPPYVDRVLSKPPKLSELREALLPPQRSSPA
jgi:CheY-like chemotaxis protein